MKPEPVFNSSRKLSESMSNPPPRRLRAPISEPPSRRFSESTSNYPSRKLPAPVVDSSVLLIETGSVAITVVKEQDTDSLYPVTTVNQDIVIDARGDAPTTEPLVAALRATMATTSSRQPIVIPGARKRAWDVAQTRELSKPRH